MAEEKDKAINASENLSEGELDKVAGGTAEGYGPVRPVSPVAPVQPGYGPIRPVNPVAPENPDTGYPPVQPTAPVLPGIPVRPGGPERPRPAGSDMPIRPTIIIGEDLQA